MCPALRRPTEVVSERSWGHWLLLQVMAARRKGSTRTPPSPAMSGTGTVLPGCPGRVGPRPNRVRPCPRRLVRLGLARPRCRRRALPDMSGPSGPPPSHRPPGWKRPGRSSSMRTRLMSPPGRSPPVSGRPIPLGRPDSAVNATTGFRGVASRPLDRRTRHHPRLPLPHRVTRPEAPSRGCGPLLRGRTRHPRRVCRYGPAETPMDPTPRPRLRAPWPFAPYGPGSLRSRPGRGSRHSRDSRDSRDSRLRRRSQGLRHPRAHSPSPARPVMQASRVRRGHHPRCSRLHPPCTQSRPSPRGP